jgi:uncharacterized membrane protein
MRTTIAYVATAMTFLAIDLVWLGIVAKSFYRSELRTLIVDRVRIPAALLFYVLFPLGLVIFAVYPALASGDIGRAAMLGGAFGFFAYATYDLTNWATLRDWSMRLTLVDLTWGTLLSATCAAIAVLVARGF